MTKSTNLGFGRSGQPLEVLEERVEEVPAPEGNQVTVEMIAAPINPSDVLTVQGLYPIQPPSKIGGHEGVGRVTAVGPNVVGLSVGQTVIPIEGGVGTWRTCGNFAETAWHPIPEMPIADAATLFINPGTALAMLRNFVDLQPGDVVVQDGANSSVGEYVIVLAKAKGVKTVNIVRDRPDWDETVQRLEGLGATLVVTPESVAAKLEESGLPAPKLALDCVGGPVAASLAELLAPGGTLVNYGAMAALTIEVPVPLLIFKGIQVRGFWVSSYMSQELGLQGTKAFLDELVKLVQQGSIKAECKEVPFSEWKTAFEIVTKRDRRSAKIMLKMQ